MQVLALIIALALRIFIVFVFPLIVLVTGATQGFLTAKEITRKWIKDNNEEIVALFRGED